jgi:type I restriction enzyme M protein
MAVKKSELYSTLLESCNELRGGMDASQYKDYVLVVLFMKYISDKAKADTDSLIELPKGCTFDDLVAAKNKSNVGEVFNKILEAVAEANPDLRNVITNADFCDEQKLGKGKDLVDTVSNLIGVFQNSGLNFSGNREADDDLIGDAYEYLMKNFASQSGKSKGQFYTPAEVSRLIAKVVGIGKDERPQISIYDPTCGSGSLLLRAKAEAKHGVSVNGQESDLSTIGMAKMNMIIHGEQTADLRHGDTINSPLHYEVLDRTLQQFDYVVANPPFSLKSWLKSAGADDKYGRWGEGLGIGVPPEKCGDYAFLLHIIKSLNHKGHGACILPHGVLFRGNAEAGIREYIVKHRYINGIIGLPSNLFYGTSIPACIIVLDKEHAVDSKGIFMINANEGFTKDGAKNRLREQDIKRIMDTWEAQQDVAHYARFVSYEEIAKNDYNLNLPRYIEAEDKEIVQDIDAHLHGGIPEHDIRQMRTIWEACPQLQSALITPGRPGYYQLAVDADAIRETIAGEQSFVAQRNEFQRATTQWSQTSAARLKLLTVGIHPKLIIAEVSEPLLSAINASPCLVDGYDAYDQLMNYWAETMQDDCYIIAEKGWKPELMLPMDKKGVAKKSYTYKDLHCDLLPVSVVIDECFPSERDKIKEFSTDVEAKTGDIDRFEEENEETFSILDKVNATNVKKALKTCDDAELKAVLQKYLDLDSSLAKSKGLLKDEMLKLTKRVLEAYPSFTENEVKHLVVDCKWMQTILSRLYEEMTAVRQHIADNVSTINARYAQTLGETTQKVNELESKVLASLKEMGFEL